jgi:hypothetical protein
MGSRSYFFYFLALKNTGLILNQGAFEHGLRTVFNQSRELTMQVRGVIHSGATKEEIKEVFCKPLNLAVCPPRWVFFGMHKMCWSK